MDDLLFSSKKKSVLKLVVLYNIAVIYDMRTVGPVDRELLFNKNIIIFSE